MASLNEGETPSRAAPCLLVPAQVDLQDATAAPRASRQGSSCESDSHKTKFLRVQNLRQSDVPWCGNASRHVDEANYRNSRRARIRCNAADEATIRLLRCTRNSLRRSGAHPD